MSIKVMTAVWDSAVPAPERFTLLALADAANDDGWCWPSVSTIGRKVRLHETTVQRHLTQLVEQGLLERRYRTGHSTMYRVVASALPTDDNPPAECDPPQTAGGSDLQGDPPAICDPTPPQSATQNRKEPKENPSSSPAAAADQKPEPKDEPGQREDVEALCARLRDRMVANECVPPTITKEWRRQARLLLDRDKRELSKALNLIDWCQQDNFWAANIHSLPKFRQQYDKLRQKATDEWQSGKRPATVPPTRTALAALPSDPGQAFAQLHERADVDVACELLGRSYVEEPQRPSDQTPRAEYRHRDRQRWLDENRDPLLAALRQRSAA